VHRARLHDGREVAVKIRRPGIVRTVEDDFRLLGWIGRVLGRLPGMSAMPFSELIAEIETPVRQQLDFGLEAESNRRLRRQFENVERIRIPELVEELCSPAVLTMEYLPELRKVTAPGFTEEERQAAALAGLRALYKMIFLDGFIHADLHPGNVFLRSRGELVILDTGLVTRLEESDLQEFVDFFFGIVNNRGLECARIVWETALHRPPGCDLAGFEAAMVELIGRHSALRSRDFAVTAFAAQLMDLQRRFGIRGSTKFIMTILAMVVFDGICKQLHPECDFQGEARGYLIWAKYRHYRAAAV
jgi:ubiquinone biosynthesis protein